jgi:hypothetical protein
MTSQAPAWLLLISNLPGRNATVRMRLWRALKAAGAGMMRDGAYVLPISDRSQQVFEEQAVEIKEAGGLAHIVSFQATSAAQNDTMVALFDRTAEYAEVIENLVALKKKLPKMEELGARQALTSATREVAAIVTRDFFPGEARKQMEGALIDAEGAINACFAPDEPTAAQRKLTQRDAKNYRGRTWATRERLWVDRVASAWLIRRFIDPNAKFLWLRRVKECPKRAVGFDFDAAEFTHVGSKVTFEVLVASFGLERDIGLVRLGALIHHLDVGGIPVPEGPGLTTIMTGARALQKDDDALLRAMTPVFDALYAGYVSAKA